MSDLPLLLRVGECAKVSGLSRYYIMDLCKSGAIQYVLLNKNIKSKRIRRDSFLSWLDRRTVKTPEDLRRLTDGRRTV